VLLDCPNSRFLRLAKRRLGDLFPSIPGQSGFNKRLRELAPQLVETVTLLARLSPSFCDRQTSSRCPLLSIKPRRAEHSGQFAG
jgi:hypothetical protein